MALNSDYARFEFSFIIYKLTSSIIYKVIIINK